jgi:hypothetical protein
VHAYDQPVEKGARIVARRRVLWPAAPGRVFHLPWSLLRTVEAGGGDVTIGLSDSG